MEKVTRKKLIDVLNIIADYIIRIILVNILVIFTSLPILTIIPSLKSGFKIFSDYTFGDERPIIKTYFKTFVESLDKSIAFTCIIIALIGATYFNNRLYSNLISEHPNILYNVGYYITMVIIIATIMVSLYIPLILAEKDELGIGQTIKLAFYLSGRHFLRTILMTLVLLIPILMFATPFLIMLFIFMGLSLPLMIYAYILKKVRVFVENIIVESDENETRD